MNKINITEARKEMSNFFDSVIHEKPIVLKRRKNEAILIEKNLLKLFLLNNKIEVKSEHDKEKNVVLWAHKLNVWGKGTTKIEAVDDLCANLSNYANEIYNNFMFYFYGQNISENLGFIFNILLCENNEELKKILVFSSQKKKNNH